VVVIHGGGWNSGNPLEFPELNSVLAREGYAVASVDYRLLPSAKWPTQKDDVLSAIQYLIDHAHDYSIDPTRIVLLGRSAGGQLAEVIAFNPPDELKLAIVGCIAFYARADMNVGYQMGGEDDLHKIRPLLREYLDGTPESNPKNYHDASAFDFVDPTSPPILLLHGRHDEFVPYQQSLRLTEEIQKIRGSVLYLDLPWATHGFDYNIHGPGGQLSTQAILGFLKKVF
jgi:acetyl esterase/lipase